MDGAREEVTALGGADEQALSALALTRGWDAVIDIATAREEAGDLAGARRALEVAARHGFGPAWHNLGLLLAAEGQPDEAMRCYRNAVRLGYAASVVNIGRLLEDAGDAEGALAAYREVSTTDADARNNLGLLLLELGRVAEARAELVSAAEEAEEHPWALSDVFLAEGDLPGAVRCLERAIAAGEARASGDLARLVDQDDETLVCSLFAQAITAGAVGASADLASYLHERGHSDEALSVALGAVDRSDSYAPLAAARILADFYGSETEARAMYALADREGDDVAEEVASRDAAPDGWA